ncbi:MAG: prepilin peptidase [Kiritimatiellae bacterium]|nr:prepilin peptidase [Kiritimatiellia bacterium]
MLLLLPWLAVLCVKDLKTRRLPNVWTLGGLACALVLDFVQGGGAGLTDGLAAAGVCILFLLIPFFVRAAGGGDVKMLAACGAFVGMKQVLLLLIAVSFAGFFVALALLVTGKVGAARMKHAFRTLFDWRYDRAAGRAALPPKEDEGNRVPFGLAIAIGTVTTVALEVLG